MKKWIGISLGALVGISHISMIGMLANRSKLPVVNVPVGPYTSYQVSATEKGYTINYRANDPKVMHVERDIKKKGGFLGLGKTKSHFEEQYTMEGSRHLYNADGSPKISAAREECIKAAGGGESTGKIVGGSIGAAVGTTGIASIPYVGWVLAGAATMLGMEQGAEIGGQMAMDFAGCEDVE